MREMYAGLGVTEKAEASAPLRRSVPRRSRQRQEKATLP